MPKVGWQLDPFGHSLTQGVISKEIGFQGMFFQRMNYVEKEARFQDGTRIFNWDLEHFDKKLLTIVIDQYTSQKPLYHDAIFNSIGQPDVSTYAYLGTIHILRQHLSDVFGPTPTMSA